MLPERLTAAQAKTVAVAVEAAPAGPVHQALHAARSQHSRTRAQRSQLQRLRKGIDKTAPVITLPQLPLASLGAGDFAALGRRLAGKLT
jgi:hypothetical protein